MKSSLLSLAISSLAVLLVASNAVEVQPSAKTLPAPLFVQNATVFAPPANWTNKAGAYGRSVLLNKNCEQEQGGGENITILATSSLFPPDGPYQIIHKSTDYGASWSELSKAYLNGNATLTGGIILQPFLYELAQPFGKYQAGTILLSANRIPADRSSSNIQLYASTDKGVSWDYVSTVAYGGPPNTDNGAPCVWEPFILAYDNQLHVYYSDQRDPDYGQKLAHQSSRDLISWGDVVNDVAYANYTQRPGMITVAQIGNGKWMCAYEVGLWTDPETGTDNGSPYATHYKIADSPLEFGADEEDNILRTPEGTSDAGPYVVWTPAGGPSGTIIVSDSSYDQFFLNTENGDPREWKNVSSQGHGVGYSRALSVLPGNGGRTVQVYNGGMYGSNSSVFTVGDFIVPGPAGEGPGAEGFPACSHDSAS